MGARPRRNSPRHAAMKALRQVVVLADISGVVVVVIPSAGSAPRSGLLCVDKGFGRCKEAPLRKGGHDFSKRRLDN